ncbi:hypothetical protein CBS101457_001807 [Exobasidium rhododendri]|nr:hypothetical protein CBS101457_001807 [Exobasidium rhododendri]
MVNTLLLSACVTLIVAGRQCIAQILHADEIANVKRLVNPSICNKLVESQNVQMIPMSALQTRDFTDAEDEAAMLEARSAMIDVIDYSNMAPGMLLGTRELQRKVMKRGDDAAAPFLGYNGHTYQDHKVFGGTNISNSLMFEFYECDYSDFMNYKAHTADDGTTFQYGIVKVADTGLCLQAAKAGERNQKLIEDKCPASDDSKQFLSFFEFRSRVKQQSADPSMKTTVRSLRFLGKPNGNEYDIPGEYKLLYNSQDQRVSVDYQESGSSGAYGEEVAFILPQKRVGK